MAFEATLLYETELPIQFTCADGTGIEKGALLTLSDPMTVATTSGASAIIAGIAAEEKIANDGRTKISVYRRGIFKMYCSGAVPVGECVSAYAPASYVGLAGVTASGSRTIGVALETGATGETIVVDVNCGVGGPQVS